jgi:hypothetical protein
MPRSISWEESRVDDRQFLDLIPSETPLRKVNRRSSLRETGYLTGRLRPGVSLDYESWNERAFIVRAELDPRVTEIYEQCLELPYRDESRTRRTIVDFCITVDGRREWHEVKDDKALEDPEERRRLRCIAKAFADRGHRYSVTRRSALRNDPEYEHLCDIFRRFRTRVSPDLWSRIDLALEDGPASVEDLLQQTKRHGATFETFLALLCQRRVTADLAIGITPQTIIYPAGSIIFPRLIPFCSPLEAQP